ncbi:MAG TPA: aconitate hydratase, partial [Planctomycetes bacterium]|nr:aconitate hydratase [Planctomycetota bacterium]
TSCTNTSNPSVMLGAGLLARNALAKGLKVPSYVKTSMAPGSRVVSRYLDAAGLTGSLGALGFDIVGYGCTTCIGNSGPLPEAVTAAIEENDLVAAAVLSGNRNFEGRVNPLTRTNYLASPPLVVAYAIAGTMDIDLVEEPLGEDAEGQPVYLRDIWPKQEEIRDVLETALTPDLFEQEYGNVFDGNEEWNAIPISGGEIYEWNSESSYIREPSFFTELAPEVPTISAIADARVLALLGDSVTTDHISPAGAIPPESPAESYLEGLGIERKDFNSFGSRRGNHEVMIRGTFGNIRLRNLLVPGVEGGVTLHHPSGEQLSIFDAAARYREEGTPLVVLAAKEYGTGSSRDWAAKGTYLLGVRAVIAESYERIHRSNLIGMGVLPLEFKPGEGAASLGLDGTEVFSIEGLDDSLEPRQALTVRAVAEAGEKTFETLVRIDSPVEVDYYRNGGILHTVLRALLKE